LGVPEGAVSGVVVGMIAETFVSIIAFHLGRVLQLSYGIGGIDMAYNLNV